MIKLGARTDPEGWPAVKRAGALGLGVTIGQVWVDPPAAEDPDQSRYRWFVTLHVGEQATHARSAPTRQHAIFWAEDQLDDMEGI